LIFLQNSETRTTKNSVETHPRTQEQLYPAIHNRITPKNGLNKSPQLGLERLYRCRNNSFFSAAIRSQKQDLSFLYAKTKKLA
jgi:hypothetical protein